VVAGRGADAAAEVARAAGAADGGRTGLGVGLAAVPLGALGPVDWRSVDWRSVDGRSLG